MSLVKVKQSSRTERSPDAGPQVWSHLVYSKAATATLGAAEKKTFDSYLTPHTQITAKWIKNVKGKRTKLLEYSIGEYLQDLGLGKCLLKGQKTACAAMGQINKLSFTESKKFS